MSWVQVSVDEDKFLRNRNIMKSENNCKKKKSKEKCLDIK